MIGIEHVATQTASGRIRRTCGSCGHQGEVEVVAQGTGVAQSPLMIGMHANREKAAEDASSALAQNMLTSVEILACPSCGHRENRARFRVLAFAILPAFFVGIFAFLFGGFALGVALDLPYALGGTLSLLAFGALTTLISYRRQLREHESWAYYVDG
jgi:hypothetical protein